MDTEDTFFIGIIGNEMTLIGTIKNDVILRTKQSIEKEAMFFKERDEEIVRFLSKGVEIR